MLCVVGEGLEACSRVSPLNPPCPGLPATSGASAAGGWRGHGAGRTQRADAAAAARGPRTEQGSEQARGPPRSPRGS